MFAAASLVVAQSPTPSATTNAGASPSPAKKRAHKKAETSPAAVSSPAASASPAKTRGRKKAEASTEPGTSPEASASPATTRARKKNDASSAASATPAVSASPAEHRGHNRAAASAPTTPAPSASAANPLSKIGSLFKKPSPGPVGATTAGSAEINATPAPGGGPGLVWVNTDSHIYHKEGSRFYGKTKQGKYVTEADAIKEGDRAAKADD
jgi:hypothetical protein